jgi:pimeloyl-ACP methyl ester carboxylesterase
VSYTIPGTTQRSVDLGDVTLVVHEVEPDPANASDDRPLIVLSHGFPELAYSWRHQLTALGAAGYRAIAPDQRGYGDSSRPDEIAAYDIHHLTGDLVGLLDHYGVDRAVFVGHDWGGLVVWQMPLLHRDRVAGVVGVNTPYLPRAPMPPIQLFRQLAGDDFYMVEFQQPGVADTGLARDVPGLFDAIMRTSMDPTTVAAARDGAPPASEGLTTFERIVAAPRIGEPLLSPDEMSIYVDTFTHTGFTGGINWYRNLDRNWETTPQLDGARIDGLPCLMITAEWDPVLSPALAQGMPALIDDLEVHEIARCGHWTQAERPDELDALLVDWLGRRF